MPGGGGGFRALGSRVLGLGVLGMRLPIGSRHCLTVSVWPLGLGARGAIILGAFGVSGVVVFIISIGSGSRD